MKEKIYLRISKVKSDYDKSVETMSYDVYKTNPSDKVKSVTLALDLDIPDELFEPQEYTAKITIKKGDIKTAENPTVIGDWLKDK